MHGTKTHILKRPFLYLTHNARVPCNILCDACLLSRGVIRFKYMQKWMDWNDPRTNSVHISFVFVIQIDVIYWTRFVIKYAQFEGYTRDKSIKQTWNVKFQKKEYNTPRWNERCNMLIHCIKCLMSFKLR